MYGVKHTGSDKQRRAKCQAAIQICIAERDSESADSFSKLKAFLGSRFGSPRHPVRMAGKKAAGKADLIDQ